MSKPSSAQRDCYYADYLKLDRLLAAQEPKSGRHGRLARANIITDVRGERIRFGFGCYHTAEEIEAAVAAIARAIE